MRTNRVVTNLKRKQAHVPRRGFFSDGVSPRTSRMFSIPLPIVAGIALHWWSSVFFQSFFLHRYAAHRMFELSPFWQRTQPPEDPRPQLQRGEGTRVIDRPPT